MNLVQYLFENSKDLDKDFVLGNKEVISYKSLYHKSSCLASFLHEKYGTNQNIILVSHNNSFFLCCYLGIILSGNVCVPLNPLIEKNNLQYIIEHTESVLCCIEKNKTNKLNTFVDEIITNQNYEEIIANKTQFSPNKLFDSNSPAEIIYTSGSTGMPMGVVLSHKNIIANTNSILKYLHLNRNDTIEIVLPFYYCYGLSLLHTHLRVGGSVVLNNNFILLNSVITDLQEYKCTGFSGVPSHFQILLRKSTSFKNTKFPCLRYVTQAGGKLHNTFIKEFTESFPEIEFYVMYGQTEATARLSYLHPKNLINKLGSIGKGIPEVTLRVVDEKGDKIIPGDTGEIIAKGDNIMLGYFKDPESTKKNLRNGWLYTGDIGTVDDEGYIYLTARKKEIIKIAGKRVSPKEIEEVIVSNPNVVDCTIVPFYDTVSGEAIKAVVVLNNNGIKESTEEELRRYCSNKLAFYKIPKLFEISQQVKISSTGKKVKQKL